MVAYAGSAKGVAAHVGWQRLQRKLDVIGCHAGQCPPKAVPSDVHLQSTIWCYRYSNAMEALL